MFFVQQSHCLYLLNWFIAQQVSWKNTTWKSGLVKSELVKFLLLQSIQAIYLYYRSFIHFFTKAIDASQTFKCLDGVCRWKVLGGAWCLGLGITIKNTSQEVHKLSPTAQSRLKRMEGKLTCGSPLPRLMRPLCNRQTNISITLHTGRTEGIPERQCGNGFTSSFSSSWISSSLVWERGSHSPSYRREREMSLALIHDQWSPGLGGANGYIR